MDNQHRRIAGYRDLTEGELVRIERLKGLEEELCEVCDELAERATTMSAKRWAALARTNLEAGMMFAIKTVAQPRLSVGTFLVDRTEPEEPQL